MSADDFQTKYASVMEAMLKSAVAETTKLFETMVNELKAEISKIKEENEDLKTRCSQFESDRNQQTVYARESEPLSEQSDGTEKRDTATQCDLVPFRTILVEQCQPLRLSPLQSQEEMEYVLKECNYETHGEENSRMAFIHVKQEDDSSLPSLLKQEEVESTVVSGQDLSDKAESPWTSACGTEKECSTKEILWPQRQGEHQVTFNLEHSVVVSLAEIQGDKEEESGISQKIPEIDTQGEFMTSETRQLVVSQPQSDVEPFEKEQSTVINDQTGVTLQQYADVQSMEEHMALPTALNEGEACFKLKNGMAEVETSSQPDLTVRRRRGRPSKKAIHPQQQVKEIFPSPSSDFPTEQEVKKSSTIRMKDVCAVERVKITSESPQAFSGKAKESLSEITSSIQDKANTALEDEDSSKMGSLAVTVTSLSIQSSSLKEKTSESQQPSIDMKEEQIQAPFTEIPSAIETLITPLSELPQVPSDQPREQHTSVTLQDAILLVEAMNQSIGENTVSPPRMTAAHQTQYVPHVDKVSAVHQAPLLSVETHDAVGTPPITELLTKMKSSALVRTTDATPTNEAQTHIKVPKQQHVVSLSNTMSSMPASIAATQTSVQSLQQHRPSPLITLVAPSRQNKTIPHKIIVIPRSLSSLMPHKFSEQSSTQHPLVTSTAVAAQNDSKLPRSMSADMPLRTPSLSSVPQKTIYIISSKLLPVVTQCNPTSEDPQSGTQLHSKYTTEIPRQVSAVTSRKYHSQTVVTTAQQQSAKSTAPVMVSSLQLISSSQELRVSQTALDEIATTSSQKRDDTSKNLGSSNQTAFVSEMKNAQIETCSSVNMSVGLVPAFVSSAEPPTSEQKLSAVVRLSRLPFPISTKESVLVSRLPSNESSESQSILKDIQQKSSSFVFISAQPSETLVSSTDICPNLKETSFAGAVNTSQSSKELNDIKEKASLSSENSITSDESPHSSYVQPSMRSKVSQPVFEKSTMAINTTKPTAVSGTVCDPTSNLPDEAIDAAAQQCALTNDQLIEDKQSSAFLHLTSITSKDTSDPHLQMTKTQFLAQLAVSPVAQESEKTSSFYSVEARPSCAETSTNEKKKLQKNSFMAQLRSHIKTHLQARKTEKNSEPGTESETQTVSPKKPRLENDYPNVKNTTGEPIPQRPKYPVAKDVPSLKSTPTDLTPISPKTSGLVKNGAKPKMTVNDPSFVSSRGPNATSESTPVNNRRSSSGRDVVGSREKKSTSVSPMKSISSRNGVGSKNKKCTSVHPRTCLTRDGASPKNKKVGSSPNDTKTTSVRPRRTGTSRDDGCPKKTIPTSVSPATSGLSKNNTSPKVSTIESTSVIHTECTFTEDHSSTEQIKRESNLCSPGLCSTTTTKGETNSPSVRSPKLTKNDVSHRKTKETLFKKQRLSQDGASSEKNLRLVNAKLAEAAKASAQMKRSNQSKLQNGAKTSQLAENSANPGALKKYSAKAVWTPPKMLASETPPKGGKRSAHLPGKKEANFPRSQDHTVVYQPSVSLQPVPVRAPPIVSPLQPLSVIGWRLLKNQCGECGRVLSSSAALESHVSLHKGRRPFSCTLCGKHFPDSKGLKRHGRVHRNGRIHVCQKCGKGFVYRFCLTKHIQMVHSKIRPFVCQICDKGFFTKRDVEAHIRLHTGEKPFHCDLCEKKFARRVELNVHLRWHNGEKRHWCPYCGKGFLDFNNLKRHKYVHTGEKPHSCPHCPKNFKQSGHLKKHIRNVHKIL